MADFNSIIPFTLLYEGGYANDKDDAGGETYRGISRVHNPDWDGWPIVDMHVPKAYEIIKDDLLEEMVKAYYYSKYWTDVAGDQIADQRVAKMIFDWQVHSGDISTKTLQAMVGVKADGWVGPVTVAAINAQPAAMLFDRLKKARIDFLNGLVARKPANKKFLNGWLRRVNAI